MKSFNKFTIALLGLAAFAMTASAASITGSIGFGDGNVTYLGANLGAATQVTMPTTIVLSSSGGFAPSLPCTVATPDCVPFASFVDVTGLGTFAVPPSMPQLDFFVFDSFGLVDRYHFNAQVASVTRPDANNLTIKMTGTFFDAGLVEFGTASVDMSFVQTNGPNDPGADSVTTMSGNFATPASFSLVPEPGTWALFGSGLIGMAVAARRKLRKG